MTRALLAALLVAAALRCSAEIVMPRSGAMGTLNGQTIACQTPETFGTVLIMLVGTGRMGRST
jgi:hypothetical protein